MKSLNTLIRLHKWKLNEERRKLADLVALSDEMRQQLDEITAGLRTEAAVAAESVDAARSFSVYLRSQTERRERIVASITELEREIADVEESVAEAFRELKTYEISLDRRNRQAAREQARREQVRLDEVGLQVHRLADRSGAV